MHRPIRRAFPTRAHHALAMEARRRCSRRRRVANICRLLMRRRRLSELTRTPLVQLWELAKRWLRAGVRELVAIGRQERRLCWKSFQMLEGVCLRVQRRKDAANIGQFLEKGLVADGWVTAPDCHRQFKHACPRPFARKQKANATAHGLPRVVRN